VRAAFMGAGSGAPVAPADPVHGGVLAGDGRSGRPGSGDPALPGRDPAAFFAEPFPRGLAGNPDAGRALYLANCVPCHGVKGDGQGPRAYFILPRPRDFRHPSSRASFNRPRLFASISQGKTGSEMPAWEKVLTPQQIADIGEHVLREYIRPDRKGPAGSKD